MHTRIDIGIEHIIVYTCSSGLIFIEFVIIYNQKNILFLNFIFDNLAFTINYYGSTSARG